MSGRQERLRRSELSVPAAKPAMAAKALATGADLVFLDLEDAVAPNLKPEARTNVVTAFRDLDWGDRPRTFRVNAVPTPWFLDDVLTVVGGAPDRVDIVIVPKVRTPRDVWFVDDLLTQLERRHGIEPGHIGMELLIEEAAGLANVEAIAAASPRLEALILGPGDLGASLGARATHVGVAAQGYPGDPWHHARTRMTVAARANGLDPIDGTYADFRDDDGYRREASWAATLGMAGKWCIHPNQVPLANEVFAPTADEIAEATAVVAAVREAEARGEGAAQHGGVMVDAASARVFEAVLERARRCGLNRS